MEYYAFGFFFKSDKSDTNEFLKVQFHVVMDCNGVGVTISACCRGGSKKIRSETSSIRSSSRSNRSRSCSVYQPSNGPSQKPYPVLLSHRSMCTIRRDPIGKTMSCTDDNALPSGIPSSIMVTITTAMAAWTISCATGEWSHENGVCEEEVLLLPPARRRRQG